MSKETFAEWLKAKESALIIDLWTKLNEHTPYYLESPGVLKPQDEMAARILEFGQPATGKPATLFLENTIEKWKKANEIKG